MANRNLKICCISSHGGHLHELMEATKGVYGDMYWVTYKTKHTIALLKSKTHYFVIDPQTSKVRFFINAIQSLKHLIMERPRVVVSTGSGIAIPTILLAKWFLHSKIIYIESAACVVEPSSTGRFVYKYADLFLIQWESLRKFYPNAKYTGVL